MMEDTQGLFFASKEKKQRIEELRTAINRIKDLVTASMKNLSSEDYARVKKTYDEYDGTATSLSRKYLFDKYTLALSEKKANSYLLNFQKAYNNFANLQKRILDILESPPIMKEETRKEFAKTLPTYAAIEPLVGRTFLDPLIAKWKKLSKIMKIGIPVAGLLAIILAYGAIRRK